MLIRLLIASLVAIFFVGCEDGYYDNNHTQLEKKEVGGYNDTLNE